MRKLLSYRFKSSNIVNNNVNNSKILSYIFQANFLLIFLFLNGILFKGTSNNKICYTLSNKSSS